MLIRFDPFRELDRMAEQLWARPTSRGMPMDAYRRGDRFYVHFDLPGVDPSTIDLTLEKDVLSVKAERRWKEREGDEIAVNERPQGTFTRQVFLGENLDREHLTARYEHGVLTLEIPLAEKAKTRKIAVTAGDGGTDLPAATTAA